MEYKAHGTTAELAWHLEICDLVHQNNNYTKIHVHMRSNKPVVEFVPEHSPNFP